MSTRLFSRIFNGIIAGIWFFYLAEASARFGGDGVVLDLNVSYVSQKIVQQKNDADKSVVADTYNSVYDLYLGKIFANSFYVGLMQSWSGRAGSENNYAAGIGYFSSQGPYLRVHTILVSRGWQVDLGVKAEFYNRWFVGLGITRRSIQDELVKVDETFPMAGLGYLF